MKRNSVNISALFLLCAIATTVVQCSSARKKSSVAPPIPDVSQTPPPTVNENGLTITDTATNKISKNDRADSRSVGTKNEFDSTVSKTSSNFEGGRVLHFSSADFSLYDTPYDSARERSQQRSPLSKQDSSKLNQDTKLGILTAEQAQKLVLDLSKTELVVLSLTDQSLFENFENEDFEKKFAQYGAKYLLVVISKSESQQGSRFMTQFYRVYFKLNNIEQTYKTALKEFKSQNDTLEFKSRLIKNR